jgi:hypothetical protein
MTSVRGIAKIDWVLSPCMRSYGNALGGWVEKNLGAAPCRFPRFRPRAARGQFRQLVASSRGQQPAGGGARGVVYRGTSLPCGWLVGAPKAGTTHQRMISSGRGCRGRRCRPSRHPTWQAGRRVTLATWRPATGLGGVVQPVVRWSSKSVGWWGPAADSKGGCGPGSWSWAGLTARRRTFGQFSKERTRRRRDKARARPRLRLLLPCFRFRLEGGGDWCGCRSTDRS